MGVWQYYARRRAGATGWIALAAGALACLPPCAAQHRGSKPEDTTSIVEHSRPDKLPAQPSQPPSFAISVEPLGFSAPGPVYLGQRFSFASLDFIGENRLLFTFRVPGLLRRQAGSGSDETADEHRIKAVVLSLPGGAVEAEALWTLYDRGRYLWMLNDGRFLLRDRDQLQIGDASLELKPWLHFPGPVLAVALDPSQQFVVTNSREPATAPSHPGDVPSPPTAQADVSAVSDPRSAPSRIAPQPDLVVRILRRDSGQVMLVSRVRSAVHLPINSEGYLELLPGKGADWVITMNSFTGASATLGQVDSTCTPSYDFLSQQEFIVSACNRADVRNLVAMDLSGRRLWENLPASSPVWPQLIFSADGSRLVRESLAVTHPVTAYSPLDYQDIKGQLVEVFDAATGKVALTAPVSPVFDVGGNVAISPSGRRVAVLDAGAIQLFDLPAPPQVLPVSPTAASGSPASGPAQSAKTGP